MKKMSNTDTPSSPLDINLPRQLENQMCLVENRIAGLDSAAEAMTAIGDGGGAGLSWAAEKLGEDVMELEGAFSELRELVYAAAPAVKAEAERQAGMMAGALGRSMPAN